MRQTSVDHQEATLAFYRLTQKQARSYKKRFNFLLWFAFTILCGAVAGIAAGYYR